MRRLVRLIAISAVALHAAIASGAGPASAPLSEMDRATSKAAADSGGGIDLTRAPSSQPASAIPDAPSDAVLTDVVSRQRYLLAMQRYYDYRANGYEYRSRVFEWQLLSSRIIFLIVLLLVGAGIYFAAIQFHVALGTAKRAAARASPPEVADQAINASLKTQLEVSTKGIAVNSSVLGVVILSLSLAFFYLYLVYVYPIQNVI